MSTSNTCPSDMSTHWHEEAVVVVENLAEEEDEEEEEEDEEEDEDEDEDEEEVEGVR